MTKIREYIQDNLSGDIQINDLVHLTGICRTQFLRRFKATLGVTPHQLVIEMRLQKAKELLADRGLSVAEIAEQCGFSDATHLATTFRRLLKSSPRAWRAQISSAGGKNPRQPGSHFDVHDNLVSAPKILSGRPGATIAPMPSGIVQETVPAENSLVLNEFRLEQTSLRINDKLRLVRSSRGLGWTNLYAAITDESPHDGVFGAVPAVWIAMALTPNDLRRTIAGNLEHQLLPSNTITLTPSSVGVQDEIATSLKAEHVYLRQSFLNETASEIFKDGNSGRSTDCILNLNDPILQKILGAIRGFLLGSRQNDRLKADYISHVLAVHLLTRYSSIGYGGADLEAPAFNSRETGRIFDYITENISANMSVDDLAQIVNLKTGQFIRRFKATMNMTPHHFLTMNRIYKAKKFLMMPNMEQSQIALLCGFSNQSHFITTFKQFTKFTPNEYRKILNF
jgi:AraC-like DNA-binding protein